MTPAAPRPRAERRTDALAQLTRPGVDVWVATAEPGESGQARPYLVPVSLAWLDDRAVIAVEARSRTARNLERTGSARLAVGPTRDVVIIDAELERSDPVSDDERLAERYVLQADWDPRTAGEGYVFLTLRPTRIQSWREANELPGRTLMSDSTWLA